MKRIVAVVALALALMGVGMAAAPGPFIGVEITWGWPCINVGLDSGIYKGWISKYEPIILSGWWGAGFEGRWRLSEFFPHFKVLAGARMAVLWEDWVPGGPEGFWYWGPSIGFSWDWGPFQANLRGLLPIPVDETKPFFGVALSVGVDICIDYLWNAITGK